MSKESKQDRQGALGPKQRWSVRRKREVVLRLLRGEPLDAVSREVGVEVYRGIHVTKRGNRFAARGARGVGPVRVH